jgi:carboxyl-terminal processing protease
MGIRDQGLNLRRLFAGAVAGFILVAGCSAEPRLVAAQPERPSVIVGEQVFMVGYGRIAEIYLQPVDIGRLAVDGLAALSRLDPAIGFERRDAHVVLRAGGAVQAEFPAPGDADATGWAMLTARAVERARAASPALDEASDEEIYEIVFEGIMADLDAYSRYTSASRAMAERAQREGYGGIGAAIEAVNGAIRFTEVMPGAPADRAGIRAGDRLLAINGSATAGMPLDLARDRLRGPAGSVVDVTVGPGEGSQRGRVRRLSLYRERVIPNTVTMTVEDGIATLRIDRFNAATAINLREAIATANLRLGQNARGFILDLRGNPGGLLDQAVAVADIFIPEGSIVTTRGRHPDSIQRFEATGDDAIAGLPLVVLLDGRSASASEIVAAALQDSGRAVVIGASSYGKGSVQTVTRLPNDGELFLTWSRIYAPSGYTLHLQGVTPTVCTSRDAVDAGEVIRRLREGEPALPSMLASLRRAAPEDESALSSLRTLCPWKDHAADLDLEVARRLLSEDGLYRRIMQMSPVMMAER